MKICKYFTEVLSFFKIIVGGLMQNHCAFSPRSLFKVSQLFGEMA